MKILHFLSAGLLLTALNASVFAEKEVTAAKEDEAVSSVEKEEAKETAVEETEAKKEDAAEASADAVTDFNAGLANLVGDIMTDEQFAHEEAEEEADAKSATKEGAEGKSDDKVVAKNEEAEKDSKE